MAAPVLSRGRYAALFAAEARDQLARAGRAAAGLRAAAGDAGAAGPLVDEAFRAVHTIKGMAAAMGYAASEAAADAAEHRLGLLRAGAGAVGPAEADAVVALVDALEGAVEADTGATHDGESLGGGSHGGNSPGTASPGTASPGTEPRAPASDLPRAPAPTPSAPGPAGPVLPPHPAPPRRAQPVRVDAARLDALLDLAGELAAARGRLAAAAAGSTDPALARAVQDVARVAQELQVAVVEARLVPLSELFERLPRVVREAARAAGREVAFEAAGGDAAVDRGVLDALGEPLTHLLRNAVDHGVEPPAARVAAGKPAAGRVRVAAERVPGGVIVTVEDDGRGVDRAAVLAAARRRGAAPPAADGSGGDPDAPADALDDAALLDLLARPGLTTAAAVTRVSGRGVGVDAALARVRALGGALTLDTRAGQGTRFSLRVPLTLAVTPVLLVRAAGRPYALPLTHVRGTREPATGERAVPLARLLGLRGAEDDAEPGDVVLLDGAARGPVAAGVDRVVGQLDCVVKPLPRLRGAFRTAATATILDAGEVALVLDVPALVARPLAPLDR